MNPLRTIRSITPHINSLESRTRIGQNKNVDQNGIDGIPLKNIGTFSLFERHKSNFSDRSAPCPGTAKSESENLGGKKIENDERENNDKIETFDAQIL